MKTRRFVLLVVLGMLGLLLTGCLDVKQEITFKGDNTGHFLFDMGMSQELLSLSQSQGGSSTGNPFESDMSSNPYVTNYTATEYDDSDMHHYMLEMDITDMMAFFNSQDVSNSEDMMFSLTQQPNGNYLFKETLNMSGASSEAGLSGQDMSSDLVATAFAGKFWTLRIKVPNVVNHNGTLDSKTGFLEWKIPMADLMSNTAPTTEMWVEFRPGTDYTKYLPYAIGALVCCVVVVLIVAAVVLIVVLRKKKKAAPAEPPATPTGQNPTP